MEGHIKLVEIKVKKQIDRSDDRETYSSGYVDGRDIEYSDPTNGHRFLIQFYDPAKDDKDSRETLIRITHILPTKTGRIHDSHQINFCIDQTGHGKHPHHLNISGPTKTDCSTCQQCSTYILPLNHISIKADIGSGDAYYKITRFEKTFGEFCNEFEQRLPKSCKRIFDGRIY